MKYKTELHCHSASISRCAHSSEAVIVDEYKAAGYTTIVLTNHLSVGTFEFVPGDWADKVRYYIDGYRKLVDAAKGELNILLGAEINLHGSSNDYLVYGITEKFLLDNPDILYMSLSGLSALCRNEGLPIYQAHPFRKFMTVMNPKLLDGIEVDNGNIRHDSSNPIAQMWADRYNMRKITGSDYHDPKDLIGCGLETDFPITTNERLLEVLKSGEYNLLYSGLK